MAKGGEISKLETSYNNAEKAYRKAVQSERVGIISTTELNRAKSRMENARKKVNEWYASRPISKKEKGGGVGEKYEVTFEDVFSFATMKKTGVLTDKQYEMALRQKKNKDVVIDKFNKSQGIREQYRIKDIKKVNKKVV